MIRVCSLLIGCALAHTMTLAAQQSTAALRGTVRDGATGAPVAQAVVRVADGAHRAATAADGGYRLDGLLAGRVIVTVRSIGYAPRTDTLSLAAGEERSHDVTLVPAAVALPELSATSTKFSVPASEVPQSGSVLSRQQLDDQGVRMVQEALRYVPSAQSEQSGRTGYDEYTMRGFSQSRYQFRDGLRLDPGYLQQQEPYGLEAIEVLRGPASVTYGQMAPGGVLNMQSKAPTGERVREVGMSGGMYGAVSAFGDLGGQLGGGGRWTGRLTVLGSRQDDAQRSVGADRIFLAPTLGWTPSGKTSLVLRTVYQRDRYDRTVSLPFEGTLVPDSAGRIGVRTYLGEPSLRQLESPQVQLGYTLTHQFTDAVQARQALRYLDYSVDGPIVFLPGGGTPTAVARGYFTYRGDFGVFSLDNQVEGAFRTGKVEHRVLAGLELVDYRATSKGDAFDLQPINPFAPSYGGGSTPAGPFFSSREVLKQAGAYAQYRAKVAERLVLSGGLRYSDVRDRVTDRLAASTTRQNDTKTSFMAGLVWLASAGFTPYLSMAESFEPQVGYDPLLGGGTPPPSIGRQYEAGVTWRSRNERVQLRAAGFQIRQTNIVNSDPNNPGFSLLSGEQRHRGIDLEAALRLAGALRLDAAYAWLDAEITESTNGDEGRSPLGVPKHAASVFAVFDAAAAGVPGGSLVGGVRYQGKRRSGLDGFPLPAFTVTDLGARYRIGPLTAAVDVRNLFNRRFYTGTDFGTAVVPGEPRMVVGSLRTSF